MRRVVCALWGAALLSGAVGCEPGAEMQPGDERPLGDVDGGEDAAGEEDAADGEDAASGEDAGPEVRRCDAPLEDELEIDYQVDLGGLCPGTDPHPQLYFKPPLPVSDGSVWIWGMCRSWLPNYLLLVHVDAAGTVTRTLQLPEPDWHGAPDWYGDGAVLALDEHGDPWLATLSRLQHYSRDLEPVGEPFVFDGWDIRQMENVPGYGFAFMGVSFDSGNYDRFGLIDHAGQLQWSNDEEVRWGAVPALAAGSTDQIAVAATRRPYLNTPRDPLDPMNILAYGPDGASRWMRELPPQLGGAQSLPGWVQLKSDAEGNLFVGAAGDPKYDYALFLQKLSADGVPEWLWQLDGQLRYTVELATGRVFASVGGLDDGVLIEITADGESCRRHPYSGIYGLRDLGFSPTGELFFVGQRSVGRFRPIDP